VIPDLVVRLEPTRYGGRVSILTVIAMMGITFYSFAEWYSVDDGHMQYTVSLSDPLPDTWYSYRYDDANEVLHWTGLMIWVSMALALIFLASVFKDARMPGLTVGIWSVTLASAAIVYFAMAFGASLPSGMHEDPGNGWRLTAIATTVLAAAVGIRAVVVLRDID
jgi:hypothetical protein